MLWREVRKIPAKLFTLMATAFVDMVGLLMIIPLLPFYVKTLGGSGIEILGMHFGIGIISGFIVAVMLFAALLGVSNATTVIPANTTIQEGTPDELRGRVFSVLNALSNLGSTAPVLFVGVIADLIGVGALMLLIGLVIFVIGVLSTVPLIWTRVDTHVRSA